MNDTPAAPARTSYAHHGEDLAVLDFFQGKPGVFIEAGANHPIESSQTYLLEQQGWTGILIEPNPHLAELCRQLRPRSKVFACALVEPGGPAQVRMHFPGSALHELAKVVDPASSPSSPSPQGLTFDCPARHLNDVLAEAGLGAVDFFSIDLEGYEAAALRGFDWKRWRPRLLSVEDHCEHLQTWRRVRAAGYRFLRRIGDNDWYVPPESPHRATPAEHLRLVRKKILSLPLRKFRRLARRVRGRQPD
jgi:FkbM family methyltransferase